MKRFLQIIFTAAALALEIFTKAAVMVTAPGPDIRVRSFYSYFDLAVFFGGAVFPPLITAVLTCVLLILGFAALKNKKAQVALCILAPITFVVSLLPLLYGVRYYSLLGSCISLALLLSALCAIWAMERKKQPQAAPPHRPPPPPAPMDRP